ncbi:MAG: LysR family transcriptional regulator [Proteobacteria bacterium]|nr:LysR family transcriptional regulator [Pseudomonadota bacterium]
MDLSLSQLSTVLAIASAGSVTEAASLLGRSQPSVSRALKDLEDQIGCQIFDRATRPFTPTPEGEILLRHVRAIRGEISGLQSELTALQTEQRNLVRIGAHAIPAASLLPAAVSRLKSQNPTGLFEVSVDRTLPLLNALREGHFDFVISTIPDDHHDDLVFEQLYDSRLGVYVRHDHPLASMPNPTLADAVGFPWLYPSGVSRRMAEMENQFLMNGLKKPEMAMRTMSISLSRQAVLSQDWVILVHGDIFEDDVRQGRIVHLFKHDIARAVSMGVARRGQAELSDSALAMVDTLKALAAKP